MARKFISYNGRIVSDNLSLKLLGQDVGSGPQCGDTPFTNTKSIEFDGVNDYIDCGNPTSLQITGALTISAWIKTTNTTTNSIIVGKDGVSTGTRSYQIQVQSSGEARFIIFKSGGQSLVSSTTLVNDGNWHHVMGVNNGSDLKIYVDGILENTTIAGGGTILNGTSYFAIGRREANAPQNILWYNGNIDEVAIWNSDQSANISTIYNSGIPNDLCTLNPLSWWRMGDGDTFPTLTDNGSGGNDGTMTNMTSGNIVEDVPPSDWEPTNVNVVAWIDASDTSSYTTAGSTLTSVTDKAGTYTMNIGNTPTVVSGGLNSLNVFDFNGSGEYLQSSTYSNQTSSGNHWAIGVFLADFVDGDKDSFWSYETNQSPKRDYAISSAGGGSNSWPGELDLDALSSNRISSTIGNKQDWDLQSVSIDSWVIVSCWFNKTGNQIGNRVNGNNAYTPVNDYDNSISPNQELRLMRNRASQELDGRLAEFFTVADLPGTGGTDLTDLEKAEGYLAWKWGLEGNLPVSHPYKNSPPTV
jgi:hypothetical protein